MIKPIKGSWFEFVHLHTPEGMYYNPACTNFTCKQWAEKVKEVADIGMEYLVLTTIAYYEHKLYDPEFARKFERGCDDPLEAVLNAADKYGVKFFISTGIFGNWQEPHKMSTDPEVAEKRLKGMGEVAEKYGHHESFYGWYHPNEAWIKGCYGDDFIAYVNSCSSEGRKLLPKSKMLIAPYGTNMVTTDDKYISQLENLDVDIIAYQDEVGVQKATVDQTPGYYEALRKAHDKAGRSALWADVETFEFEGEVYFSALIPAEFARLEKQLAAVSPYVDNILVYIYQGIMNRPGTTAFMGHPDSTKLYENYVTWLRKNYPEMVKV